MRLIARGDVFERRSDGPLARRACKLKRNVRPLSGGLPIIGKLRPITAVGRPGQHHAKARRLISVIAQGLREVIPDAVEPVPPKLRAQGREADMRSCFALTRWQSSPPDTRRAAAFAAYPCT